MKSQPKTNDASRGDVQVTNATRTPWNARVFGLIAQTILPPTYSLSVVFIGDTRARALNRTYRNKNTPADVLSFPLAPDAGEVFINLARVKRDAHKYGLTPHGHSQFLLIHGCLHLIGYDHGSRMEQAEQKYLAMHAIR